jgi:hypothetical protein
MGIYDRDYMRRQESPSISLGTLIGIAAIILGMVSGAIYFSTGGRGIAKPEAAMEWAPRISTRPVNVNTATPAKLASVPYLSSRTRQALIEHRPYATLEDLTKVPGIKRRMLERISPYIKVE